MNFAGILGAGKGTRMGNTPLPKQFLDLGGKPIIIHTVDQFMLSEYVDKIVVAVPSQWIDYAKDIFEKYYGENEKIDIIVGSDERNKSIICICEYIQNNYEINNDDVILTHDAVRPFITQKIINDNVRTLRDNDYDAVDTVIPAIDTIVQSSNSETITNIPVRSEMYQGQTPQTFYVKDFIELYQTLSDEEKEKLTDAIKAYVLSNKKVGIEMGDQSNFKLTSSFDLMLARKLVNK